MAPDKVRELVRARTSKSGLRAWCRKHNVASGHASEFLSGQRGPASDLLTALGLEYQIVRKRRATLASAPKKAKQ